VGWEKVGDADLGTVYTVQVDQRNQAVWAGGGETCIFTPFILKSIDMGNSWREFHPPFPGPSNCCYDIAVHPTLVNTVYAALDRAIVMTVDGGETWQLTGLNDVPVKFSAITFDSSNPQHIWVGGTRWAYPASFSLWESFDGGKTWCEVDASDQIAGITSLVADPNQAGVVYIGTFSSGMWRYQSPERPTFSYFPIHIGNTWRFLVSEAMSEVIADSVTETIIDTSRYADKLYYVFDKFRYIPNAHLRMSDVNKLILKADTTETVWLNFGANVRDSWMVKEPIWGTEWRVFLQSKDDSIVVPAGTFTNCYRFRFQWEGRDNDWEEWYAPAVGPIKRVHYGDIVWEYQLNNAIVNGVGYPTKVSVYENVHTPTAFQLYQNHPNPFNAVTIIRYDLSQANFVVLEIYDILGKKINTLISENHSAGQHGIHWDGKNDSGQPVGSGVYLCRLQAGRFSDVKRMVLLR